MKALKLTYNFSEQDIRRFIANVCSTWGLGSPYVLPELDKETAELSASLTLNRQNKQVTIELTPEVVRAAICMASAAEGNPLDPASLTFNYDESKMHGRLSATATEGAVLEKVELEEGKVYFPATPTLTLGASELKEIVKQSVQRAGHHVTFVTFIHSNDDGKPASAELSIKRGDQIASVAIDGAEVEERIIEEMSMLGFEVRPGISYRTLNDGNLSRDGTTATLTLTAIPKF